MFWVTLKSPHHQLLSVMRICYYYELVTNYLFHCRRLWHSSRNASAFLSLCSRVKRAKEQNWCKQTAAVLLDQLLKCRYGQLQWTICAFIHLRPHYMQLNANYLVKSRAGYAKATQTQVDVCPPTLINKAMRSIAFPRTCLLVNPTGEMERASLFMLFLPCPSDRQCRDAELELVCKETSTQMICS